MWRTNSGNRVLTDGEWRLFATGMDLLRDFVEQDITSGTDDTDALRMLERARKADVIVKASGIGVFDELLEREVARAKRSQSLVVFWDVDAPATLDRMRRDPSDPFRKSVPKYDLILTYGGGPPVIAGYRALGAHRVVPIYNALDPRTHFPTAAVAQFAADV